MSSKKYILICFKYNYVNNKWTAANSLKIIGMYETTFISGLVFAHFWNLITYFDI